MKTSRPLIFCVVTTLLAFAACFEARAQTLPAGGAGDGPPIDLTCVGLMAPATVHVRAGSPRDAAGNSLGSAIDYRYEWDFGDTSGKWNNLPGWNGAHVYDRPGQYNITLTVRGPGGKVFTRTSWVRIAPDDRKKIHVSNEGNDALDGSTQARAVKSPYRAFQLATKDAWVLFRRGDTFDFARSIQLRGRGLRVGNYSRTGDDWSTGVQLKPPPGAVMKTPPQEPLPILRKTAITPQDEAMLVIQRGSEDILIEGVEFDSIWSLQSEYGVKKVPVRAFTAGGNNFTLRWCSFRNLTDGVNTEYRPTGMLIQDCHFSNEIRGHGIYLNGQDHVIVGNVMLHSRQEHLIRASEPGVTRLLIAYNDLRRPTVVKGCIELRCASWFYVAGNHITSGTLRVGPQEQDQKQYPLWRDYKCDWGVVEDNRLDQLFFNVRLGTYHVVFRNNLIRHDGGEWAMIVACQKPGYDDVRKVEDLRIEHNTVINQGDRGQFLYMQGKPIGLSLRQNVYIAPNIKGGGGSGGAIYLTAGDLDGFAAIEGNVFPDGAGGQHHVASQPRGRSAWNENPKVKAERYERVEVDADDNVPLATNAGAKLGSDKREREAKGNLSP